ncbi:MAG: hypothetical protein VYA55_17435 [Pseudomonadota bacterium]|nr:hypothetical protein [Pseudomonadota bacterium]
MIAHRLWTITQADSILVMRQGETVQVGGHRELNQLQVVGV